MHVYIDKDLLQDNYAAPLWSSEILIYEAGGATIDELLMPAWMLGLLLPFTGGQHSGTKWDWAENVTCMHNLLRPPSPSQNCKLYLTPIRPLPLMAYGKVLRVKAAFPHFIVNQNAI